MNIIDANIEVDVYNTIITNINGLLWPYKKHLTLNLKGGKYQYGGTSLINEMRIIDIDFDIGYKTYKLGDDDNKFFGTGDDLDYFSCIFLCCVERQFENKTKWYRQVRMIKDENIIYEEEVEINGPLVYSIRWKKTSGVDFFIRGHRHRKDISTQT